MSASSRPTKRQMLILEDASLTGRALERTFKSQGYEVSWMRDSIAAVELLRERTFDIIVTDLVMPKLQGIALIDELRRVNKGSPIIVFSGYLTVDTAVQCIKAGATHAVEKSENTSKIIDAVRDVASATHSVEITRAPCPGQKVDAKTLHWKHLSRAKIAWNLTDTESQVLDGIVTDKTTETMAMEFQHSKRWVESVIKNLFVKATARSRTELINKFWVELRD